MSACEAIALPAIYELLDWQERREVRAAYSKQQDGKCYYCKSALTAEPPSRIKSVQINWRRFPRNFLRHPVHLHHDHTTGLTIGAVHALCNAVLWQVEGE
jgi:hypothetical protein